MSNADKVVEKTNLVLQYFEDSVPALLDFGVKVILSLLIYFIGVKLIHVIQKLLKRAMDRGKLDLGVRTFLNSLSKILLYFKLQTVYTFFNCFLTSVSLRCQSRIVGYTPHP